jgi:hypothetical protein
VVDDKREPLGQLAGNDLISQGCRIETSVGRGFGGHGGVILRG